MAKFTKREYRQLAHKHHTRRGDRKFPKRPDPVETAEILTELAEEEATQEIEEVEEVKAAEEVAVRREAPMSYGSIDGED